MQTNRMEAVLPQINIGATVCAKLKIIYYPDKPWIECYRLVAGKFTELKNIARKFYAGKSEIEILQELAKYSNSDIIDAMSPRH